jgi:hypothetical protein
MAGAVERLDAMSNNPWVQVAKYMLVALIWTGVILFGIALSGNIAISGGEGAPMVGMGIAAFIAAAVATAAALAGGSKETEQETSVEISKRKNDQRGIDPLSLLTEDDIAELREDIKHNLRRRMLEGQDGELGSLDALLAENDHKARRR